MTNDQFSEWIIKYTPKGVEMDDFVEKLAMGSIGVIEQASINMKKPVSELIKRFYFHDDSSDTEIH